MGSKEMVVLNFLITSLAIISAYFHSSIVKIHTQLASLATDHLLNPGISIPSHPFFCLSAYDEG